MSAAPTHGLRPRVPGTAARARALSTHAVAWAGIALGLVAVFVTLPPALLRTPIPSLVLAAAAVAAGVYAVRGDRAHAAAGRGSGRLGWGAVTAGIASGAGAVAATRTGEEGLEAVFVWSALIAAMLRFATPLTLAALGGIVSERSGIVNIGLEGMMLMGALFGIVGADLTGSWLPGLLIGMVAGGLLALVHAFFAIHLRADQIVSGFAVNFLAIGITGYVFISRYGDQGTPDGVQRVPDVTLPGIESIPFVGDAIGTANLLTWLSLVLVVAIAVFLFRTPAGLRLRSVGENPRAAASAGLSVFRARYLAVVASGVLAAAGGAYLSIGFLGSFNEQMTQGRGFIALAAVIFGNWRPAGALAAALLFGFSSALAQRLPEFSPSTATLFQALPYVLTLIAVAGFIGRSRPPAAVGQPYVKE